MWCSNFLIWCIVAGIVNANFNIFVPKEEVKKLLGVKSDLYYVTEGVVNDYAMDWNVKVPARIHSIVFYWQALSRRPVLYNIAVRTNQSDVSAHRIILAPSVNISASGTIPRDLQPFRLDLQCTGEVNGEVKVVLNINLTSPRAHQPPIVLNFIRNKICLQGVPAQRVIPHKAVKEEDEASPGSFVLIYILTGIAIAVCSASILATVLCWRRKLLGHKRKCSFAPSHQPVFLVVDQKGSAKSNTGTTTLQSSLARETVYKTATEAPLPADVNSYASVYRFPFPSTEGTTKLSCQHTNSSSSAIYESSCYSSNSSTDSHSRDSKDQELMPLRCSKCDLVYSAQTSTPDFKEELRRLQIDRERVRLTEVLHEGRIGRLYRGWVQREHPQLDQQVLIKTLREGASDEQVSAFFFECSLLSGLRHQNLLTLAGVSLCESKPPFFIYPDMHGRNLKSYLKKSPLPMKIADLVRICLQVVKGLSFIHTNSLLHKDIATRNCIINENHQVRITDASLARDIFPEDYELDKNFPRPIRWMAPEVISDPTAVSTASDIWSLGVLMWELASHGSRPYPEVPWDEISILLQQGMRLSQPITCPDELHRLMTSCWVFSPRGRPETSSVINYLSSFKTSLNSFV